MKKIFCGIMCLMMGMSSFAVEFPGWKCKDLAKIEQARQEYVAKNDESRIMQMDILKAFANKDPKSFADIEAAVDSVKKIDRWHENGFIGWKIYMKKFLSLWVFPEFMEDGWKFCQNNPTHDDIYFIIRGSKKLGLSNDGQYSLIISNLIKFNNYSPKDVIMIINKIIDLADSQDPVQVKKDLQRLNRKYSRNLLKDKTAWEPIVALIRTTLDTY